MNRNTSGRRGGRRPSEESDTATFTFTPEKKKPSEDTGEWATGKRQERSLYEEIGEDDFHISPNRNDLITCQYCGEEYSTTYRRCPCCDERTAGQNLSSRRRKNDFMDPRHLVGVVITFVIIISAGVIVFQQMKPLLGVQNPPTSDTTGDTTPEITPPVVTTPDDTVLPDQTTTPDTVTPDVTTPDTTTPDVTPPASTTLSLNYSDITLQSAESLTFTLSGAGSQTVTWKSSHPEIATVDANGKVENINSDTETKTIEITATVGSESVSCVIRCKPSVTEPTTPETTTPETTTPKQPPPTPQAQKVAPISQPVVPRSPGQPEDFVCVAGQGPPTRY